MLDIRIRFFFLGVVCSFLVYLVLNAKFLQRIEKELKFYTHYNKNENASNGNNSNNMNNNDNSNTSGDVIEDHRTTLSRLSDSDPVFELFIRDNCPGCRIFKPKFIEYLKLKAPRQFRFILHDCGTNDPECANVQYVPSFTYRTNKLAQRREIFDQRKDGLTVDTLSDWVNSWVTVVRGNVVQPIIIETNEQSFDNSFEVY